MFIEVKEVSQHSMQCLNDNLKRHIDCLIIRYPNLDAIRNDIINAYLLMARTFELKGKLLIAGNGGSAADADHIVGELMKGFRLPRKLDKNYADELIAVDKIRGNELVKKLQTGLPSIALTNHVSLNSAFLNDVDGNLCFAQQVNIYGNKGDIYLGISTSGNSTNIMYASVAARAKGLKVIGLTGADGGELADFADVAVKAPEMETYKIQELHLPIYHCWCLMLEEHFFNNNISSKGE